MIFKDQNKTNSTNNNLSQNNYDNITSNPNFDKTVNALSQEKVVAITRFIKSLVSLQTKGETHIDGDDLLKLAKKCFGEKVTKYEWNSDNAISNIMSLLDIPEEKRLYLDNLIHTFIGD